jgi:hypothetical protein
LDSYAQAEKVWKSKKKKKRKKKVNCVKAEKANPKID